MKHHLYLVRHGESTQNTGENAEVRIPDHAIELTDVGKFQADSAGRFLLEYFDRHSVSSDEICMWISPYKRTRQTANHIQKFVRVDRVNCKEDPMLTELQFGIFDAVPKNLIPEQFPSEYAEYKRVRSFNGKYFARRPGGESPMDCEIRQKLWLESLYRDIHAGTCKEHILVVGHGAALTLLRKAIFHYGHNWYEDEPNPSNCSIQHIILDPERNIDKGYIFGFWEDD